MNSNPAKSSSTPRLRIAPAPSPRPRAPRTVRQLGVVQQIRSAFKRKNLLATFGGAVLGGFVPLACFTVAHQELSPAEGVWQVAMLLVLGGLSFSFPTIYGWGKQAFQSNLKAIGFAILVEGVMILSKTDWLRVAALVLLIAINAIATGCRLALKRGEV